MTDRELDTLLDQASEPSLPAGSPARFAARYPEQRRGRAVWKWALAGAALTALTATAFTQAEAELISSVYPLAGGQVLVARTIARPGAPAAWRWAGRLRGAGGMRDGELQQVLGDRLTGRYWGYRVSVRSEGAQGRRLIFTSVRDSRVTAPAVPAGSSLDATGVVEFALSREEGLFVRLSVEGTAPVPPAPADGFALKGPRVFLDGVDLGSAGVESMTGTTIYVARAGLGRLALARSSMNDARFQPAGTASGRRIEFRAAGHLWRIECAEDLPFSGPLYVLQDAGYQTSQALEFGSGGWAPGAR
jgi:hypothetical protein